MTIQEMKEFLDLCLQGKSTILKSKEILRRKRKMLLESMKQIQKAVDFIDWRRCFSGKMEYHSNLIKG